MDPIDLVLEEYESNLKKASEGQYEKINQSTQFRNLFQKEYRQTYEEKLEQVQKKLLQRGHRAEVRQHSTQEQFYGFALLIIPRHLLSLPSDMFFPSDLRSSISFVANEHTLSVDVETVINPNLETKENTAVEKIPLREFNEDLMMEKIHKFLETVFNETITIAYSAP